MQRLREAAEKAKIELSTAQSTDVNLPFVTADETGPKHLNLKLSRAKFEQLVEDLDRADARAVPEGARRRRAAAPSDIDEVVLVGGSTRIPLRAGRR